VQSASTRHSGTSVTRRATQRPAWHTARKALSGSGTIIAHATSSHCSALQRTAMHMRCAACNASTLMA
jgi:LSD1 subclass zinc finger protein